ncbi:MAG: hypothetical protein JWN34_1484 [Bryobacterales bacterium]|nr:hypothetical protein [Bryobacterales bacterium]
MARASPRLRNRPVRNEIQANEPILREKVTPCPHEIQPKRPAQPTIQGQSGATPPVPAAPNANTNAAAVPERHLSSTYPHGVRVPHSRTTYPHKRTGMHSQYNLSPLRDRAAQPLLVRTGARNCFWSGLRNRFWSTHQRPRNHPPNAAFTIASAHTVRYNDAEMWNRSRAVAADWCPSNLKSSVLEQTAE